MAAPAECDAIEELATRLAAAYISYAAGMTGIDQTLEEIRGDPAGEVSRKLAVTIIEMMNAGRLGGSEPSGTVQ